MNLKMNKLAKDDEDYICYILEKYCFDDEIAIKIMEKLNEN